MPFVFLGVLLTAMLQPAPAAAQDVVGQLSGVLSRVESALGQAFARALPLPAASPGVSYSFDPATGNFRRDPATFGQLYLDRADPLGARHYNLSFSYEYVQLNSLEGHDAGDLRSSPIPVGNLPIAIQIPRLSLQARVHNFLFAFTYGLTDDVDASVAVPLVYSDLGVRAQVAAAGVTEDGQVILAQDNVDDPQHPVGVGDVLLRAKYRLLNSEEVHVAAALQLRFPSGSTQDLQGIGFFEVTPNLLASTRLFQPAAWARLQGHVNAGFGFNTEDVDSSEVRWGIGLDWGFTEDITAAVAILGLNQLARVGPAGSFQFPSCDTDLVTCAGDPSARHGTAPLFGLSGERPDYYNISVGGRGALWRDQLFAFTNVLIPLNDGFVGTDPIPVIGIEGTF